MVLHILQRQAEHTNIETLSESLRSSQILPTWSGARRSRCLCAQICACMCVCERRCVCVRSCMLRSCERARACKGTAMAAAPRSAMPFRRRLRCSRAWSGTPPGADLTSLQAHVHAAWQHSCYVLLHFRWPAIKICAKAVDVRDAGGQQCDLTGNASVHPRLQRCQR